MTMMALFFFSTSTFPFSSSYPSPSHSSPLCPLLLRLRHHRLHSTRFAFAGIFGRLVDVEYGDMFQRWNPKKWKDFPLLLLPDCRQSAAVVGTFARLSLYTRVSIFIWKRVWSIGGIMSIEKNQELALGGTETAVVSQLVCLLRVTCGRTWRSRERYLRKTGGNVRWRRVRVIFLLWKSSKRYILWVCVCSLRYPACNTHAPYCHLGPGRLVLATLPHKLHNYKKKNCLFWFSVQRLSETFLILRRIRPDIAINVR